MKRIFPFIFLGAIPGLWAQQTFSLIPNPVFGIYVDDYITEGRATVKNLSATAETFRWTRTVVQLENDSVCETQVSDPYVHWHPLVSEKTFELEPQQEGPLYVALWDFEETGCCAIVHMKLKKLTGAPDSIEAFYYLRTCQPLAVSEVQESSIEIFPNPVAQYFSLKNANNVSRLTLCDASGKMLRHIPVNTSNRYPIADLPRGAYYLVLQNEKEAILQALEFVKG